MFWGLNPTAPELELASENFDPESGFNAAKVTISDPELSLGLREQRIMRAISNTRFFITEDGSPALGPLGTHKGDTVAILSGGNLPFILRRSKQDMGDREVYQMVGNCYVDGLERGQAVQARGTDNIEEIWVE
jgi:hypothetical protein